MANELVAVEKYTALELTGNIKEIMEANLGGEDITPRDLDIIKVPAGGGKMWDVPTLEGSEGTKMLSGVLIHVQTVRTYWEDPEMTGAPPDCSSTDGDTGVGNPGGKCSKCPLAQFGSAGRGQACAEKRILFLLLPDRVLPVAVQIPPTSVRAVKKYRLRMTTFGLPWWAVVTGMRLESKRNNDGQEYSVVALETLARLTPTEQAKIEEYQAGIVPALEQAAHVMAQDSPGIDEEAPF